MDNSLTTWVRMQKVWHSDSSSKASTIVLRRKGEESIIFRCPVGEERDDIEGIIRQALQMQATELPKGQHPFVLTALDENGVQLSELPQTIKGTSQDATSAATEAIAMANAHAKALGNMDFVQTRLIEVIEKLQASTARYIEDNSLLVNALTEERSVNHAQALERDKFHRSAEQRDKIVEGLTPAINLLLEQAVRKYFGTPENLVKILEAKQEELAHVKTEVPKGTASAASDKLPEPEPRALQADACQQLGPTIRGPIELGTGQAQGHAETGRQGASKPSPARSRQRSLPGRRTTKQRRK
jgi:hypothetical protein